MEEDERLAAYDLPTLFAHSLDTLERVQKAYTTEDFETCCRLWRECQNRAALLGLFSVNEAQEDLATASLKYLSIQYHLGRALGMHRAKDSLHRAVHLEQSRAALGAFLAQLGDYGVLEPSTVELCRHPKDGEDPLAIRQLKISRHQAVRSLREQSGQCAIMLDGEDAERERAKINLQIQAIEASNEMESILSELALLKHRAGGGEAAHPPARPLARVSRVTEPFVLVKDRVQMSRDVFRPGHRLPTMTIDEYLALERRQGGILQGPPSGAAADQDDDPENDRCEEARETRRQRDMAHDAFKDDNPRGWGNTYNLS